MSWLGEEDEEARIYMEGGTVTRSRDATVVSILTWWYDTVIASIRCLQGHRFMDSYHLSQSESTSLVLHHLSLRCTSSRTPIQTTSSVYQQSRSHQQ
jgi:hypothetical protein